MARPAPDRNRLVAAMADHVLEHGLNTASLRPLAAAAQTSDRMLIYHFGSKEGVVGAILEKLAADMASGLDTALPPARFAEESELVARVIPLLRSAPYSAYMRVWFDIVAASAQGSALHRASGCAIVERFLDWVALRHPHGHEGAPRCLAMIEGLLLLDAVGMARTTDKAMGSGLPDADR